MSGGSLMKPGTESKFSSGADVDCAYADGLSKTHSPASHRFMGTSRIGGGGGVMGVRVPPVSQYTNPGACGTIASAAVSVAAWPWRCDGADAMPCDSPAAPRREHGRAHASGRRL